MNVLLSAYVHRRDKVRRQLTLVFHYVSRRRIYRILIVLVHVDTQSTRGESVHVSTRAQRVFTNIRPREVWLDPGGRFRYQRDRSGRRNRRHFIIAWRKRDIFRNPDLVIEEISVRFAV